MKGETQRGAEATSPRASREIRPPSRSKLGAPDAETPASDSYTTAALPLRHYVRRAGGVSGDPSGVPEGYYAGNHAGVPAYFLRREMPLEAGKTPAFLDPLSPAS